MQNHDEAGATTRTRHAPIVTRTAGACALAMAGATFVALIATQETARAGPKVGKAWRAAAKKARASARAEAKADWLLVLARSSTFDDAERDDVLDTAKEEYADAKELANDQYHARLDLAARLGEDELYAVGVDPADFVATVDNPLMPLTPGTTRTYRADTEEGTETTVVTVMHETKEIIGVTCTVVRDTVSLDGVLVEDTFDWFAQDVDGNVWYFGEIALNYEDGDISDIDGSWLAGRDGARPGIVMPADPTVGRLYRQEFLLGEAEDYAEVLATDDTATVPYGTFTGCARTFDGTPLEPDAAEQKTYAPGIGVILEVDMETGDRTVLVDVTTDG